MGLVDREIARIGVGRRPLALTAVAALDQEARADLDVVLHEGARELRLELRLDAGHVVRAIDDRVRVLEVDRAFVDRSVADDAIVDRARNREAIVSWRCQMRLVS